LQGHPDFAVPSHFAASFKPREIELISDKSIVPSTAKWLDRICSRSVDPQRGKPTMNIGSRAVAPKQARSAKNCLVKTTFERATCAVVSFAL
jgi:hypothetical protein